MRLAEKLDGWSRAAIGQRLGEAVVSGKDLTSAVVGVFKELQTAPGQVVPIGKLEDVCPVEIAQGSRFPADRTDAKMTAAVRIEYRGEDTRGIDVRDGEPVDRPIGGHERGDLQVPHETVVLDWRVFTLAHRPHLTWSIRCDPLCDSAVMGAFGVPVQKTNGGRAPRVPS